MNMEFHGCWCEALRVDSSGGKKYPMMLLINNHNEREGEKEKRGGLFIRRFFLSDGTVTNLSQSRGLHSH
jgi:hypothetical protein